MLHQQPKEKTCHENAHEEQFSSSFLYEKGGDMNRIFIIAPVFPENDTLPDRINEFNRNCLVAWKDIHSAQRGNNQFFPRSSRNQTTIVAIDILPQRYE